jgi:hypothetical protein
LACQTIEADWFTSAFTSKASCDPSSDSSATFMPIELSPGDEVKIGTAWR